MTTKATVALMARYNQWQNASLYTAAGTLDDAERRKDRGAFFGSIHGTLCHLLWGDTFWMSLFAGWERSPLGLPESPGLIAEWETLVTQRREADAGIIAWSDGVSETWLAGDVTWYSGLRQADVTRPAALCVTHFFNHQTHHRGQVHAMLTAAGATPEDTDLVAMPHLD
ncbi:MAG: DinB family protein [Pseudomonadota bacterium]